MTKSEATELANRINADNTGTDGNLEPVHADVVRILSRIVDPPKDGDNGWDVEVTYLEE